jgi:general secretion pathway protein G
MSRARGFTLLEMVIVIAVILVLASLALGLFASNVDESKRLHTEMLVQNLDMACKNYRGSMGAYPPDDKGDSRNLHFYLGQPRVKTIDAGATTLGAPFMEFRADWLESTSGAPDPKTNPVPVIDAWGRKLLYKSPGVRNPSHVDLWSPGVNGLDGDRDDVTNWKD